MEMAKSLKLGGVGAFTGENVGPLGNNGFAEGFWDALAAIGGDGTAVNRTSSPLKTDDLSKNQLKKCSCTNACMHVESGTAC